MSVIWHDIECGAYGADTVGRLVGRDLKQAMANVDRLLNSDVLTDDAVEAKKTDAGRVHAFSDADGKLADRCPGRNDDIPTV